MTATKKAKRTNYTQRSLAYLRAEGWTPWIVERWIRVPNHPGGGKRVDCYNLIDILAYRDGELIGVQSTGPSGHASHRRDMLANEHLPELVRAGIQVVLLSWRRLLVKRGGRARTWQPRWEVIEHAE